MLIYVIKNVLPKHFKKFSDLYFIKSLKSKIRVPHPALFDDLSKKYVLICPSHMRNKAALFKHFIILIKPSCSD